MVHTRAPVAVWRSVRNLLDFRRLLELRTVSQFGDGLFQAGLAGALLFNPERAASPLAIAGAFAVLFLPYSLLGPFAGALMDRWDRRLVLVWANVGRLVSVAAVGTLFLARTADLPVLCGALIVNGFGRFVSSGLSAALPHVVPRDQVVTMNSLATAAGAVAAFVGANFMLVPRWLFGSGDNGSASIIVLVIIPVTIALLLSLRFAPHVLGPDDTRRSVHGSVIYLVITGWLHGARTVLTSPTVAATLAGLAAHRMVFGINTLLVLLLVRSAGGESVGGLGTAVLFVAATGTGSFLANALTPPAVRRWGRYTTANGALVVAAAVQIVGAGLHLPIMVGCGFFLGTAGQVVKLCADTAMQVDVDDALRGHVFAVQDSLFWVAFIGAITVAAAIVPADGQAPALALAGTVLYLVGLAIHAVVGRRAVSVSREGSRRPQTESAGDERVAIVKVHNVTGLDSIVADLRAESDELDALVAPLPAERWAEPTPAAGWTIAHQIGHLLWTDRVALTAVTDEARFAELLAAASANPTGFVDAGAAELAAIPPPELLACWRSTRQRLHAALLTVPDGRKLPWFGPPLSAASMATARLMETWAHGLDVADALGVRRPATARLRSVAHIGVRTRDYAFVINGLTPPTEQFFVELRAPDGGTWSWGPPDAAQRVTGSAEDFCALVTQRRPLSALDITAHGEDAQRWLGIAQAFAGPPGVGR